MSTTCPWCGEVLEDLFDLFIDDMADAVDWECYHCGKAVRVEANTEYTISRIKPRHEDTHDKAPTQS